MKRLKLGVNIDHIATLRQARGTDYPSPLEAAAVCEAAGADGITVHLREDRRHIQDADVAALRAAVHVPLNLEMACIEEMIAHAAAVRPEEVCVVPERREEITTEGGLDVVGRVSAVSAAVRRLEESGIRVSLFVEPDERQLEACAATGAPCVELHTGAFCHAAGAAADAELDRLKRSADTAHGMGLQVNAGHGIHLLNIDRILEIPRLDTLNIGHSIIARAVFVGLAEAVREMRAAIAAYRGPFADEP